MNEMQDRIAEIIQDWREDGGSSIGCARAVFEAMREPTQAMAEAGDMPSHYMSPENAARCWRQMIDAALKD